VSRYQKGKTNLDFSEARDSEWQLHQLGHIQVCTSLQTDHHSSTPPPFFTGWMPFLPPNQQRQNTEGSENIGHISMCFFQCSGVAGLLKNLCWEFTFETCKEDWGNPGSPEKITMKSSVVVAVVG